LKAFALSAPEAVPEGSPSKGNKKNEKERPSRQNKDICRIPPPSLIEGLLPPSLSELEAKWNPGKIERKKGGHRSKKEIKTFKLLHFSQRKAREGRKTWAGKGRRENAHSSQ
jgi:hypothetical protein